MLAFVKVPKNQNAADSGAFRHFCLRGNDDFRRPPTGMKFDFCAVK